MVVPCEQFKLQIAATGKNAKANYQEGYRSEANCH